MDKNVYINAIRDEATTMARLVDALDSFTTKYDQIQLVSAFTDDDLPGTLVANDLATYIGLLNDLKVFFTQTRRNNLARMRTDI